MFHIRPSRERLQFEERFAQAETRQSRAAETESRANAERTMRTPSCTSSATPAGWVS